MGGIVMTASRIAWLVTGSAWAARSLLEFAHPEYWSPETTLDYVAVWLFTICLLLLAPTVLFIGRLASTGSVMAVAAVVAIGAATAGGANAIEDGFGVKALGTLYVIGSLTAWLGLLPLAVLFHRAGFARLSGLIVALMLGLMLVNAAGGLIVLGVLGGLAVAPRWFTLRRPAPSPTVVDGKAA